VCGIAGIVGLAAADAGPRVRRALARLAHRGPDGEGILIRPDAVLGMRRLAIIDPSGGDQPIYNEDRSVGVVCNGELYDYLEGFRDLEARGHRLQSASDVNLVPHYYEEHGPAAFSRLRGMFAVALWDDARRRLYLARDPVGKKPLFWASTGTHGLAFASELPALLTLLDTRPALDPVALADYFQLGFVPHPTTIYQGVHALPPGSALTCTPGSVPAVHAFWTPPDPAPFAGSRAEALAEIDRRLGEAVRLRLRSDVPVGLFLSGGIDSGLVAAHAARAGGRDLLCFVVEVADPALNEAPAACETARRLGLPVERVPLTFAPLDAVERVPLLFGQPFGDSSAIPTYFVAQAAARHRKVILNGDGGDEIFAGYRRYWMSRYAPWIGPMARPVRPLLRAIGHRLAARAARRSSYGFAARALRGFGAGPGDAYLIWGVDLFDDPTLARCFPDLAVRGPAAHRLAELRGRQFGGRSLRQALFSDYRLILADDLVTKMDIATMAHSLEARSPFLDVPLAEFAWSLPERWLLGHRTTKPLLRALARAQLPESVARAPKRGFEVPIGRWLAEDLRPLVGDLLLAPDGRVAALGAGREVRRFVEGRDAFRGNRAQAVWCLLVLELFLRQRDRSEAVP
jgi:asparagine synthase (glutamine-hydrolysing)